MRETSLPFVVKICGITNEEDARIAVDAGANALGFNFYPKSPRYVAPERAREIIDRTRGEYCKVGVFVNTTEAVLLTVAGAVGLDVLQLHGEGSRAPKLSDYCIWRSLSGRFEVPEGEADVEAYLLDSATPHFGGSGQAFPWIRAAAFPYCCIVAGGLDGANVAEAIETVRPWGVDACSRLESGPGKKDPVRVRAFVSAAWKANEALSTSLADAASEIGSL